MPPLMATSRLILRDWSADGQTVADSLSVPARTLSKHELQ